MDNPLVAAAIRYIVAALPTLVIVGLLCLYLRSFFFKPLAAALEERRKATEGTKKLAQGAFEAAKKKTEEYEQALRDARNEIYRVQEQFRSDVRAKQAEALGEVKARNEALLAEAQARIRDESAQARQSLETEADALAEQIARTVMEGSSR